MGGQTISGWIEVILGILLMLLVLLDVFMTILYARVGSGIISYRLGRLLWKFMRWLDNTFANKKGNILSFCGPVMLVGFIIVWTMLMAGGAALVIHPHLGTAVRSNTGETPTDFVTALYVGSTSLAITGSSDFSPQTSLFRLFFVFTSLAGASIITLTITYLMQIYSALQDRNALGLKVHLLTSETNDAADLLASLGPQGQFDAGYTNLADLGAEITQVKESHHFYPVLFYFRFSESYYSVSQFTLICLDVVTLMKSALDDKQYAWLKESVSVSQIWRASMIQVMTLVDTFLPGQRQKSDQPPDQETLNRWHRRYFAALERLRQAGIETIADEQQGLAIYVSLRSRWEPIVTALAPALAYTLDEIDPASRKPDEADNRPHFDVRLHTIDDVH